MSMLEVLSIRPLEDLHGNIASLHTQSIQNNTGLPAENTLWDGKDHKVQINAQLPSLHTGPAGFHLAEGIHQAADAASQNEPDAEQAFFVADLSRVYLQFLRWKNCLPFIEPFYAVKCNPDPYVLRLLGALGAGFDCASHGEISQVLAMGSVVPSRIIFANPCKAISFIRHARIAGVDMMTFDNSDELLKISRVYPEARLVLRILTDDSKSVCRLGIKFGAPLSTVSQLLSRAKELNLNVIGISFHVGSGCYDPHAFADAVALARKAFDIGASVGYKFTLLDVGGGFEDANFEATAGMLRDSISRLFGEDEGLKIIAEPGRFFVSRAFTLAANIIARRIGNDSDAHEEVNQTIPNGAQPQVMYYINDGVYGAFNCILFDHQKVEPFVLTLGRRAIEPGVTPDEACPIRELRASSVWGPTCDSIDCVCPITQLPEGLEVGDWLGFGNMGAYTICAASQFNGFERSRVVYTAGVGMQSIRVQTLLLNEGRR